jgi:hypothetical protein
MPKIILCFSPTILRSTTVRYVGAKVFSSSTNCNRVALAMHVTQTFVQGVVKLLYSFFAFFSKHVESSKVLNNSTLDLLLLGFASKYKKIEA